LQWLDGQVPRSVVYAAFGSEAKLTNSLLQTIALGLEASGLPFLWRSGHRPMLEAKKARLGCRKASRSGSVAADSSAGT
jgi:hypothetical protein